ncbi:ribonuclease J [Catenibacterium mitsuokai]|uniref:Ribonuclease J n=1 Tax=Catenibacterium mitsuokai TaxID=100886 RepID=A0AAW4MUF3_9FIRM|nr:ribonuclease J [Catenibacterium mitsuokai]MBV3370689.1 ribonuclease J [Catenibacterium mitsuokai]MBV3376042.1 ribonuclease J [Catenibacterium mitsuokai]MBV3378402.1 ribonuclease J [Catenibacterium mitsuokai]MBV3380518.1 ribonuclease J [Catenibacterium mitsuokai]
MFALGGLNEVGKNTYCIECNDEMIIIDAGVKFASEGLPGIDYVIPDYTYLRKNNKKIKGLFITHGHEDHIGGIPFLLRLVNIPFIYASPLACAMIRRKLEEHHLTHVTKMIPINHESSIKTKYFNIGFFNTNHSIPESMGIIVNTPDGRIIETGDFKFDLSPVANPADYQIMSFLGETGVDLLMSDSTNAEVPTFSISEKTVAGQVQEEFRKTEGRIIVATFASNIHRVQQIVEAAVKFNRKILVYGRSMVNNIDVARKMGYIKCPDRFFIKNDEAKHLPDNEILILCTGSQGEALAALNRIANGTHRQIKIKPGDTVLFSSNPIPGNQSSVSRLINKLYRSGARVLENSMISNLHTSGHASQEEQKLMMLLTKPKYFFPVHGEHKMLCIHKKLYEEVGGQADHAFVLSNGDCLCLKDHEVFQTRSVHADDIYVDGNDLTGLSTAVLHDRQILSEDGMVAVLISMDSHAGILLHKPVIMSRGFVYMKDSKPMIYGAEMAVDRKLRALLQEKTTFGEIKNTIRETLTSYFYTKTKRRPMIIPVIMNKK